MLPSIDGLKRIRQAPKKLNSQIELVRAEQATRLRTRLHLCAVL
jgi:hypothetical protein